MSTLVILAKKVVKTICRKIEAQGLFSLEKALRRLPCSLSVREGKAHNDGAYNQEGNYILHSLIRKGETVLI